MSSQPSGEGTYDGPVDQSVLPLGRCVVSFRLGTFDTEDDADAFPEERIPLGATLTITPNLRTPVILPDGTIMIVRGVTFRSNTGEFDFWAIDGKRSNVNPSGWDWSAILKIDGATQFKFNFSPDSTSAEPINLGTFLNNTN